MKEHPISMSTLMVKAILDGSKTQTRRTNGLDKVNEHPDEWKLDLLMDSTIASHPPAKVACFLPEDSLDPVNVVFVKCPYGQAGDSLWVRETWCLLAGDDEQGDPILYKADPANANEKVKWHPSIFIPRWASRITLEITEIRVQRVQEINADDCEAEGIESAIEDDDHMDTWAMRDMDLIDRYHRLWDSINGKRHPWSKNEWVWCISFKKLESQS